MTPNDPLPPAPRPEKDPSNANPEDLHEGATDEEVGDRGGPGAGYDQEPEKVKNPSGTAT